MKIIKYIKVSKSKYKIILEDNETITLYEDVILKYELLLKKEIIDLNSILEFNKKYELYDKVLSYINKKIRCEREIITYLKKYTDDDNLINEIILKLKSNNILNKENYIVSFIHDKIYLSLDGPVKIKNDLLNLGFDEDMIIDNLKIFDLDLIDERINKYLNKQIKTNKKSSYIFKNKMLLNLLNFGYLKEDITRCLDNISLDDTSTYEKEKQKLYKKYEKKYSGYELDMIVKRKLYEKGYFKEI